MKQIKHIGIAGEGKMGSNLFLYLMPYDYKLSWLCSSSEGKDQATKFLGKKLKILLHSGLMTEQEYIDKVELTSISEDPSVLSSCDLVIEAIPEDLEMKRQLFLSLDSIVKPSAIFTSNSSSILPSEVCPSESRGKKMAGLHFFFPINMKKTVELIYSPATSKDTLRALDGFLRAIGKKPLLEDESNAFILNRLLLDLQTEAYHILQEGKMTMKEIDDLVRNRFFSYGVFDFFDQVGVDVMLASIRNYTRNSDKAAFYAPLLDRMQAMVQQGRLGFKTKQGFFTYCKSLGDITKAVSDELPSKAYQEFVEQRLMNHYMASVFEALKGGFDAAELAEAVKDNLGIERDPFRLLIADC